MSPTRKIILFLALALIVILYAVVNNPKEDNNVSIIKNRKDFSPEIEVEINNPITVTPNSNGLIDTKNWPTYKSDDFGFQIKYPTGWGIEKLYSQYSKDEIVFLTFSPVYEDFFVGISISNTPFEEVVKSESSEDLISTKNINIGRIGSVLQITRDNPYESDVSYVFRHGDYTYAMRTSSDLGPAMLATLIFVR